MPVLIVAAIVSCVAGTLEVVTALLLGTVIDTALNSGPDQFFSKNAALILGFSAFFLIIRPLVFGLSAAANSIVVGPNINPLVLSRLHRWTLGQAVTFFDNDFAGRIAQKQMQTARALTDVTVESINVVAFALASLIGSGLLLITIDWRIALGAAGLACSLSHDDPLVYAACAAAFRRAGRSAGDGVGAGRRYDHQYQDRQALRPCRA